MKKITIEHRNKFNKKLIRTFVVAVRDECGRKKGGSRVDGVG